MQYVGRNALATIKTEQKEKNRRKVKSYRTELMLSRWIINKKKLKLESQNEKTQSVWYLFCIVCNILLANFQGEKQNWFESLNNSKWVIKSQKDVIEHSYTSCARWKSPPCLSADSMIPIPIRKKRDFFIFFCIVIIVLNYWCIVMLKKVTHNLKYTQRYSHVLYGIEES